MRRAPRGSAPAAALALAGLALAAAPGPLGATVARDLGLGAASAFTVDDSSYAQFPQVVNDCKGLAVLNVGGQSAGVDPRYGGLDGSAPGLAPVPGAWAGADIPMGSGALGVWFGRPDTDFAALYSEARLTPAGLNPAFLSGMRALPGFSGLGADSTPADLYRAQAPAARVDLIYAFPWGRRMTLALGINRAESDESLDEGPAGSASFQAQNLGLSLGLDVRGLWIAKLLQVGLQLNDENLAAAATGASDQHYDADASGAALRLGADLPGPGAAFGRLEAGMRVDGLSGQALDGLAAAGSESGSMGVYNLGYALGTSQDRGMALAGLMLYGDFGGDSVSGTVADTYSAASLEFSAAGEFKLCEWLTARGGFSGSLASAGSLDQTPGPSALYPSYSASQPSLAGPAGAAVSPAGAAQVSLGLGLDLGDLTVDGYVAQNLVAPGVRLVPGVGASLFGGASAAWRWE